MRPRRARRGQGEGRPGHRRRRRPGLPGHAHPDLGAQEGRRRRRSNRSRRRRTAQFKRGTDTSSTSSRRRRLSARSARPARSTPTRSRRSRTRSPRARSPTSRTRSSSRTRQRLTHAALELRGITKRFGPVVANDGVDFDLRQGEVHALLGENGAGKSTLMNVLYGLYQPGRGRDPASTASRCGSTRRREAIELGIGMVHQHFMLVPVMTVAENIVLGDRAAPRGVLLDCARARAARARAVGALRPRGRPGRP